MLDIFFTVDVEIWCDGWHNIDEKFPGAFRKYIYGPTPKGDFGLPHKIKILKQHGLTGVFFVESLFSTRFGNQPLAEIVGLLNDGLQEVQLHLHTEWADESRQPIFEHLREKRQHLRYFSLEEQTQLIALGKRLVSNAGAKEVNAFRAGSFAFNADTLTALATNHIPFDSSYNASMFGPDSGVMPGVTLVEPIECRGVHEYPMTVFHDGTRSLRHAQLTACSYKELERLLWQALEAGRSSFVLLSHSFELMNLAMNRPDEVVVKRFERLCAFLERNSDCFRVRGFQGLIPKVTQSQPGPLKSPPWMTGLRMIERAYRRKYQ
ncbi:polysaccharide deacetylase [Polaromonas sp. C04]|uniref:polysaccharide deacetylase family protein n=1 Tax=Polaromonas sp. C04 TaxID=1945857 RepID=UPI00098738BD|nr:polysaccharide deacetylase [Polaromonas sp. C04]OOG51176.1 polysaccharide deacetylase [Polaromonas sp. C04]